MLVVEYRLRPGVLRGLGGSRRLEWLRMLRLCLSNYPEQEYFAHWLTFFDKMARAATRNSKKTGPLPNLPENIWWRRGSSRGGAQRRENGPVNRFQREGGEAGFASPDSPRPGYPPAATKKQVSFPTCLFFLVEARRIELRSILDPPQGPTSLSNDLSSGAKRPLAGFCAS